MALISRRKTFSCEMLYLDVYMPLWSYSVNVDLYISWGGIRKATTVHGLQDIFRLPSDVMATHHADHQTLYFIFPFLDMSDLLLCATARLWWSNGKTNSIFPTGKFPIASVAKSCTIGFPQYYTETAGDLYCKCSLYGQYHVFYNVVGLWDLDTSRKGYITTWASHK